MAKRKRETTSSDVAQVPETKAQKMTRLGNKRVASALAKIRLIGNLAAYKPSPTQIDQIEEALGTACVRVVQRLRGVTQDSYNFTLK